MKQLIISLIAAVGIVASAGYVGINIPEGESGIPAIGGSPRLMQIKAKNVLPSNGTISIGEIAAKWETYTYETNVIVTSPNGEHTLYWNGSSHWWNGRGAENGVIFKLENDSILGFPVPQYALTDNVSALGTINSLFAKTNDLITSVYPGINATLYGFDSISGITDEEISLRVVCVTNTIPHATTNALWTVTAAGGNAVSNFNSTLQFLDFDGLGIVRYGSATNADVTIYCEE